MLYLFYGNENIINLEIQKYKKRWEEEGLSLFFYDMALKEEEHFFADISMNSMFAEKKAFVLKRLEHLKATQLTSFCKALSLFDLEDKEIILSYADANLGKTFQKELEKISAQLHLFSEETQEEHLKAYLQEKLKISSYDAEKLLEMLGKDFHKIEQETHKILQFLDGNPFSFELVHPLLSIEKEYSLFALIDAFLEKEENKDILDYLEQNPNDSGAFLYQMAESILLISKLASLIEGGQIDPRVSYNVFKKDFPNFQHYCRGRGDRILHPYPVYLKLKIAAKHPSAFWLQTLEELLLVEYQFKSGSMDMLVAVSQFILGFFAKKKVHYWR